MTNVVNNLPAASESSLPFQLLYDIITTFIEDESLIGQRVNAAMGIYDRLTVSLIKLSSFPNGFILNNTEGTTQLATTLTDNALQNISAVVTLTNADKSEKYTNDVRADLDLNT